MAIDFPQIDPVLVQIGPLAIRWYALAYIAGLFGGLYYVRYLLKKFPTSNNIFSLEHIEDLFTYVALGVIFGGRLGYVLFYKPSTYLADPISIFKLWQGGMSFHGGVLGVIIGVIIFARRQNISPFLIGDYIAPAIPIGLFFGRIANFINAELYGRITDVSWAVRFPDPYFPGHLLNPRHPSQIYEALTEGLLLFIIMFILVHRHKMLSVRGYLIGIFLVGYAVARIFCEFFREPDSFLGFVLSFGGGGITQGMILSVPMLMAGLYFMFSKRIQNANPSM